MWTIGALQEKLRSDKVELLILQLCDLLEECGEELVVEVLAGFLGDKNRDVEYFIKSRLYCMRIWIKAERV